MLLYILLEALGLWHFTGRYIAFDYSSMKLYLDNNEVIVCENIEEASRYKGYISIETEILYSKNYTGCCARII